MHSYVPCRPRLALRTVSEKSPLTKPLGSQLKPSFMCAAESLKEAMSEPLLNQLTLMRDGSVLFPFTERGNVALQGSVAFVFGLVSISLGDAERREESRRSNKEALLKKCSSIQGWPENSLAPATPLKIRKNTSSFFIF